MSNHTDILLHDCEILTPRHTKLDELIVAQPMAPFSPQVLTFLQTLSAHLLKDPTCRAHPELTALGFWLRKANIAVYIDQYVGGQQQNKAISKALGVVVHFTPANVDTMFVYSWVCSLLMGNINIVRVASAESQLRNCLLASIEQIISQQEFASLSKRNCFVQYDKSSDVSRQLSQLADARVIWGGDDSVQAIRALPGKARCRDISFADRFSAALINAEKLNSEEEISKLASLLWKDTQPYEQQACSSPRVLFWLGDSVEQKALFAQIEQLAANTDSAIGAVNNHLVTAQLIQSRGMAGEILINQAICILRVKALEPDYLDWHPGSGMYLLVQLTSLNELIKHCSAKLQTLSYWGLTQEQILKLVSDPSIQGIDRIVPVGQSLDFSPLWDGYDLFTELSRRVAFA
jgi:hypothetical protein